MKKGLAMIVSILFVLLLVACNNNEENPAVQDATADVNEVMQDDETVENEVEEDEAVNGDAEADETEATEENNCDEDAAKGGNDSADENATNCEEETNKESEQKDDGWKKPDKIDNMKHLDIVHLAYDIFAAQDRKDYDFLESIAAEGTKIDRKNNKFSFENVTYPFEMEFFTKEDLGNLEFRYTHEEDGVVYVGFGAINYEEESSFVVDFEFVEEGGKWKMRSMDINK